LSQPTEKRLPGRPKEASEAELLRYEALWVDTFRGLRDGNPEIETEVPAGSSMFIKRSGPGQEQLYIEGFGKPPRVIRQPKFSTTPDELRSWRSRVQKEQDQFEEAMLDPAPVRAKVAAIPSERRLWEALKRADNATRVRRIYSQSNIWLKPRLEFPGGGFIEHWPFRRILYRDAETRSQVSRPRSKKIRRLPKSRISCPRNGRAHRAASTVYRRRNAPKDEAHRTMHMLAMPHANRPAFPHKPRALFSRGELV